MWDSTPWFIGGGAQHSPEIARLLAYASTGAAEGIVTPGDLRVVPQDVAGSSIRVLAGAALILNRAAGGTQQTYVARNVSEDVVNISATGSGAGRSDLIVAEIQDPFMPGSSFQDPTDPTKGVYVQTTVIPNVAPTTTRAPAGMSGIALARIDVPANTAKINSTMIKDLRKLAQPRSLTRNYGGPYPTSVTYQPGQKDAWDAYNMTSISNIQPYVEIPTWATHVDVTAQAISIVSPDARSSGAALVKLGPLFGPHLNYDFSEDATGWNGWNNLHSIATVLLGYEVPANIRGTVQQLSLRARLDSGRLQTQTWSSILFNVAFYEQAV